MNELENVDSDKKAKSSNYKEYIENQIGPTLTKCFELIRKSGNTCIRNDARLGT